MPNNILHRMSHNPHTHLQASSTFPSHLHFRFTLSFFLLLSIVLCVVPICHSVSASSAIRSSSSPSPAVDVWSPTSTTATTLTDVWPGETSTAGVNEPSPDVTSTLRCVSLEADPLLTYNQSVQCTIECKMEAAATAGKVSDYEWSAEEVSQSNMVAVSRLSGSSWANRDTGAGCSTADVKFGSVTNFTSYNDSKVLAFLYTAPSTGTVGILHVLAGPFGAEIENSPIIFTLKPPANSGNSTTPVTPPLDASASSPFLSLHNPTFIAVCVVAAVLLLAAVLGGMWARRVFSRKADEVRERQVSEAQWAHSVPSLKARLDLPQPSTLRSPLLR